MPPNQELADWLRLCFARGIGNETGRKLLAAFGMPANVFAASPDALRSIVSERLLKPLLAPPDLPAIERTLAWLEQPGNAVLTLADPGYPRGLLNIPDPPLLLYVKGRHELLDGPSIAVVGSRNATAQGMKNAEQFSEALCRAGFGIVSGMALGIDTGAHHGSLRAGGASIAVIGTGADIVYPARNHKLAHQLAEEGCIISEYPLGTPGLTANFPRRNRIISGLSRGVLVVEAAIHSGSLITARMAAEQGRDVFAIPGSIHSPLSKGCHLLIKQGAKLVESAQDVLEELGASAARPAADAGAESEPEDDEGLLGKMGFDPVTLDALAARCELNAADLAGRLLALELDGHIEILAGGLYQRTA